MQIPLSLNTYQLNGSQYLKFWCNGKSKTFKSPVLPYCYTKDIFPNEARVTKVRKKLLYDKTNKDPIYKLEFNTVGQLKDCCGSEGFYESGFNFQDRIFTDCPDLIAEYANTRPLNILYLDIETDSFATFPVAKENAIIAIGYQINDEPIEILMAETYKDDKTILKQLENVLRNPCIDIIVTFNGTFFDLPYIIERMKINKISPKCFSRDNSDPFITTRYIKLGGRIHYDLYTRSVEKDQNLFKWSPPNRRMKTVARLYGAQDVVEEDNETLSNMRSMVGTEELYRYLFSDIKVTHFLSDIYLPAIIAMAEYLGTSLEAMINSSPAYLPHILIAKHFAKIGIISDKSVGEAYPDLIENKQGALTGCFKPGLYREGLRKFDIQSDYPNLDRTLNLSPETTEIIRVESVLQPLWASMDHENKYLTISIPDEKLNKQFVIGIDFSRKGFVSNFIDKAMADRLKMKKKMKKLPHDSAEYASLDVNQLNLKVLMNSVTGYYGQAYSAYGSLACYCCITGVARHIITKLIEKVGSTIALDTDGIIINSDDDLDETNAWLGKYMLDTFQVPNNYMQLEEDPIEAGFFRPAIKQYLLLEREEDGTPRLVVHGISFKGSSLPKIYSDIIQDIGLKMLLLDESDPESVQQFDADIARYYNKDNWTLEALKKRVKCKPISQYKSSNTIGVQLVEQYTQRFGIKIINETQLEYIKVKRNHGSEYLLVTIFDKMSDVDGLDFKYYTDIVDGAFERLNLLDHIPRIKKLGKQKNIFDF